MIRCVLYGDGTIATIMRTIIEIFAVRKMALLLWRLAKMQLIKSQIQGI